MGPLCLPENHPAIMNAWDSLELFRPMYMHYSQIMFEQSFNVKFKTQDNSDYDAFISIPYYEFNSEEELFAFVLIWA